MRDVLPGDVVFHLCGDRAVAFTGHSVASSACQSIESGPEGSNPLYRVDLAEFTPLAEPLALREVFDRKSVSLREYFNQNRIRVFDKERLFYVIQSGQLQCLNGAYLSYLSAELLYILFDVHMESTPATAIAVASTTSTGDVPRI